MALQTTSLVEFTMSTNPLKTKTHQVDFSWDNIEEVLEKAACWDAIKFNSAMRGHSPLPNSVVGWKVYKESK